MKLKAVKREGKHKSELTGIRRDGNIPAIFYGPNQKNVLISLDGSDFHRILRNIEKGHLSTSILELDLDGKIYSVLVKDIQYHRTTYKIEHIDLVLVDDQHLVNVNVPIECVGIEASPGIQIGGFLRQILRTVRVRCFPKNIPSVFQIDVSDLNLSESKKLSALSIPEKVRPLASLNEVVVVIAKR